MMVVTFQFSKHHPHTHAFEPLILEKSKQMAHPWQSHELANINI
jgi:hypothetical protein